MFNQHRYPFLNLIKKGSRCHEMTQSYPRKITNSLFYQLTPYLALLQWLNLQPKWQLWLIDHHDISRDFVKLLGLTPQKIILLPHILIENKEKVIQQALESENFSYILTDATQKNIIERYILQSNIHSTPLLFLGTKKSNPDKKIKIWHH